MEVKVTTLDQLIQEYGLPFYCKIDVEGYELQVLQGLSSPIPMLSFEYIPAAMSRAKDCVSRLAELADYRFNWACGESYKMNAATWLPARDMLAVLSGNLELSSSGDVYARLQPDRQSV